MNSFGRLFRVSILGESHGTAIGVLIDGCPCGLPLKAEDFREDLARRRGGIQPGVTARQECDIPIFKSGLFKGKTSGAPLLIVFENADLDSSEYERLKDTPRPGHADYTARLKYGGFNDYRGGGHFSGRLTAGLVAAGVIAKKLMQPARVEAKLIQAGGSADIDSAVQKALQEGDSIGGLVECAAYNLPPGLGEPFFDSVESLLSHAAFSIPAIKGIEFGSGFNCTRMRGSEFNDAIIDPSGRTASNHSGGLNGGLTNGNPLVFRVAVRPTASIKKAQETVNLLSGEAVSITVQGRHDACLALRVSVVLEAVTAMVLTDLMLLEQKIPRVIR